jgi:hypothetical protein
VFQTQSALYWASPAGTGLAPWITGAINAADGKGLTSLDYASMFAALTTNVADATIGIFDAKYTYDFWRPVTAIQLASQDGNPDTAPDAKFETLLVTPPVPDMPSTHSALGMAAATVLAASFGRDEVRFSFASPSAARDNPVRSFGSFSEAALENADSRVKAGLHFRFATEAGLKLGKQIGQHINRNALQRLRDTKVSAASDDACSVRCS